MTFVNLPLRYIEERPGYLDLFLAQGLHPELGLDAWAMEQFSPSWHARTAGLFHTAGLTCAVHLPFFDLHPGSLDPLIRQATEDRLRKAVLIARVYAPSHFIAHLGYNDLTYAHFQDQWLAHALDTWERVLDLTGDTPLFLENVFEHDPAQHVQVLAALQGRAGACLDLGHWHCFAGGARKGNLSDWLAALDPFPVHLHLHDNDGETDQHLGLGLGAIPWDQLWAWIGGRDLPATMTFEPHTEADFLATQNYLLAHRDILPF
jgi:sugar phosphate isomerase/epimerase